MWHVYTHPDTGYSGLMLNSDAEPLVQFICGSAFKTDADSLIGVEKMASKAPDASLKDACARIASHDPKHNFALARSIWHTDSREF